MKGLNDRSSKAPHVKTACGPPGRQTVGKACPLLLAIVGGEPPDAAPVWKHTAADRGFAAADRVGSAGRRNQSGRRRGVEGGMSEKSLRNGANHGLLVLAKALPGASGSLALERMQKKIAAAPTGSILSPPGKQNGNPGLLLLDHRHFIRHKRSGRPQYRALNEQNS